jgi:dynein heavy chain 2
VAEGAATAQKLETAAIALNKIVTNSVASSLFKQDRLMFALHLVHGIFPELFGDNEWNFLLGFTGLALEQRA